MMDFDFISDEDFRKILKRDFEELSRLVEIKASKSILILSGSIIEAVLSDYFFSFPPNNITQEKVLKMDLYNLIDLARENNIIKKSTKELSTVIKNYRNLIHPGREIRKKETFDNNTAIISYRLLKLLLKEIRTNYLTNIVIPTKVKPSFQKHY